MVILMSSVKIQSARPKKCMATLVSHAGFSQELIRKQLIQYLLLDGALMSTDRAEQYSTEIL